MDYKPSDKFTAFFAPVTSKLTLVTDQALADSGAFGVDRGENFRAELGGYIRMALTQEVMKNVTLVTKIDLFSNYLKNPQNMDVNWDRITSYNVCYTKLLRASLITVISTSSS